MTLPKTHPLYEAVGIISKTFKFIGIGGAESEARDIAESLIKDLESAGYRVVGPDITQEMVRATGQQCADVITRQILSNGLSAAPTITETK